MTLTSHRPTEAARQTGFTLIELLVVLTIMALVAALAINRFRSPSEVLLRQRVAAEVRERLTEAQLAARATDQPVSVGLPSLSRHGHLSLANGVSPQTEAIIFYPDGSSSGGDVRSGGVTLVSVDWLTGRIQ